MTSDILLGMVTVLLGWACTALVFAYQRIARIEDVLRKQCVLNELVGKRLAATVSREEMQ